MKRKELNQKLKQRVHYFAYGSNLLESRMKKRCPSAEYVRHLSIPGYKLAFHKYCNMQRSKTNTIHGVVWSISKKDLKKLDGFEGTAFGYYRRVFYEIPSETEEFRFYTYIMSSRREQHIPHDYYNVVLRGYKNFDLPLKNLRAAINESSKGIRKTSQKHFYPTILQPFNGRDNQIVYSTSGHRDVPDTVGDIWDPTGYYSSNRVTTNRWEDDMEKALIYNGN